MARVNQVSWRRAEEIADVAADRATGFTKVESGKSYTMTGEELTRILRDAAVIALREAGFLSASDAADRARNARLAETAERRHRQWRKATGQTC